VRGTIGSGVISNFSWTACIAALYSSTYLVQLKPARQSDGYLLSSYIWHSGDGGWRLRLSSRELIRLLSSERIAFGRTHALLAACMRQAIRWLPCACCFDLCSDFIWRDFSCTGLCKNDLALMSTFGQFSRLLFWHMSEPATAVSCFRIRAVSLTYWLHAAQKRFSKFPQNFSPLLPPYEISFDAFHDRHGQLASLLK
jgi:hypothetical protein